jgi:hypothetical protein
MKCDLEVALRERVKYLETRWYASLDRAKAAENRVSELTEQLREQEDSTRKYIRLIENENVAVKSSQYGLMKEYDALKEKMKYLEARVSQLEQERTHTTAQRDCAIRLTHIKEEKVKPVCPFLNIPHADRRTSEARSLHLVNECPLAGCTRFGGSDDDELR